MSAWASAPHIVASVPMNSMYGNSPSGSRRDRSRTGRRTRRRGRRTPRPTSGLRKMKSSTRLRKNVIEVCTRLDRPRTETSNPSAFSEFRSGLPISKVRLPAWLPKKYISSRAGLRAARAMLTATTRLSLAAWGRTAAPDRGRVLGELAIGKRPAGPVGGVVDAAAELHREVRPGELFVEEPGDGPLIDRRRQRFLAFGAELAIQEPAADDPEKRPERPVRQQHFHSTVLLRTGCPTSAPSSSSWA